MAARPSSIPQANPIDPSRTPTVRILYVEDDPVAASLFKDAMEQEGYTVDIARTGAEGLAMINDFAYDLIALDYLLPEFTGMHILRRLTENENHPPVIMVTGNQDSAVVLEALRLGAADYLIKEQANNYLGQLSDIVSRVLKKRQLEREQQEFVAELHRQNRNLALLNRVTQIFTSTLNEEQVTTQLVSTISEFTDTEGSSVWLWSRANRNLLECVAIYSRGELVEPHHVTLAAGQGIAGWVAKQGETVLVNNAHADPRFSPSSDAKLNFRTRSLLAIPLRAPDRILGVLELVNKRDGGFTDSDRILAETLASSAAIAIENARLFEHLNEQAEELRLRNEELDAFAHTVAHDLKTPLSLVTGFADMLRENIDMLHPDEINIYLNHIIENSMRMNHIIESLLMLAGVRGISHVDVERVDMGQIVHEALRRVEFMLEEREAVVHVPTEWPAAVGYGPWLEEVWYNYVVNALKYGGNPPVLWLGAEASDDGEICFWVQDNGPGVADHGDKLFTPSLRSQRAEERKGYGLGLSIVKRIVERLHGRVGAKNASGGGSIFYFTLPDTLEEDKDKA
ncbi:MAG: response regulator [Caldilineaceae bacterium]|nr:response regulator [Caldilineaceae bacterium]